jgi:hypothetical protein
MPPQIKQDLNRSGWESTDFPSVCESCLPENPYVQMLKEDYGAECKIVSYIPFIISAKKLELTHCSAPDRLQFFAGKPIGQRARSALTSA